VTRVSVLVPTHDHASTLPLTVRSILAQTHADLEVLVIGDGPTPEVREAARALAAADARVRFLDLPKGPHHGEVHRDTAIAASTGEHLVYCCDDDLFLPEHVADLSAMLENLDFVQSRNGYLEPDGRLRLWPGELSDPEFVAALCHDEHPYSFVSVTGTAHTKEYYRRAARPWTTTPAGLYPDHHQWRRMFQAVPPRAATSPRMTALQFPSHLGGRAEWTPEQRLDEITTWADAISAPGAQDSVDRLVAEAGWPEVLVVTLRAQYWRERNFATEAELRAVLDSRSWRWGEPVRRIVGLLRRGAAGGRR
jgi:hypothetical protein